MKFSLAEAYGVYLFRYYLMGTTHILEPKGKREMFTLQKSNYIPINNILKT